MRKCRFLCRPLLETFHIRGSECSGWHWGIALLHKGQCAPSVLSACIRVLSPPGPHLFRAERDACVWASVSPFSPFLKTEREESTDPYLLLPQRSFHPSIHPWEWVSTHTVQRSWLQSGSKSGFVSKATRLSRHFISVLWTVLQSKSLTDSSVSSLQNYSCILNTGPLEFLKKSFHNTVDSEMSLLKKSQYIIWNVLQKKKKKWEKRERVVVVIAIYTISICTDSMLLVSHHCKRRIVEIILKSTHSY